MRKSLVGPLAAALVGIFFVATAFASQGQGVMLAQADMQQGHEMHMQGTGEVHDPHMLTKMIFDDYFSIRSALARDSMENVSKNAKDIAAKAEHLERHPAVAESKPLLKDIEASATKLAEEDNIAAARTQFGVLSEKLVDYQAKFVTDKNEKAHVFFCDMKKEPWLQQDQDVGNPYFGSSMLKCGREIK